MFIHEPMCHVIKFCVLAAEKRGTGKQLVENILRDLQLTVDWNLCDLAESAILERYSWKKLNVS